MPVRALQPFAITIFFLPRVGIKTQMPVRALQRRRTFVTVFVVNNIKTQIPIRALQRDRVIFRVYRISTKNPMPGRAFLRVNTDVFSRKMIYNIDCIKSPDEY